MIAQISGATTDDQPKHALWIALAFIRQVGTWKALSTHDSPLEAGRACLRTFLHSWRYIGHQARCLRALTEHPDVARFIGDSIDGPMLTRLARKLSQAIDVEGRNIVRLLDDPGPDDDLDEDLSITFDSDHEVGIWDPELIDTGDVERLFQLYRDLYRGLIESDKRFLLLVSLLVRPEIAAQAHSFTQELADAVYVGIAKSSILRIYQDRGALVSEAALDEAYEVARHVLRKLAANEEVVIDPFEAEVLRSAGTKTDREISEGDLHSGESEVANDAHRDNIDGDYCSNDDER